MSNLILKDQESAQKQVKEFNSNLKKDFFKVNKDFYTPRKKSLILVPDEESSNSLMDIVSKVKDVDPEHYFYTREKLHTTIVSFDMDQQPPMEKIYEYLKNPEIIGRTGLLATNDVTLSATILLDNLEPTDIRKKIRQICGLEQKIYKNEILEIAFWSSLTRYLRIPSDKLIRFIKEYEPDKSVIRYKKVRLVESDSRIFDSSKDKIIYEEELF